MHPQLLLATTLSLSSYTLGAHPPALTTPQLMPRASTSIGCFNSSTGLVKNGTNAYNTAGLCQTACVGLALPVLGLSGQECWCGETLPPLVDRQADDGACDTPCPGYPLDMCGGDGFWTVALTGTEDQADVGYASAAFNATTVPVPANSSSTVTGNAAVPTTTTTTNNSSAGSTFSASQPSAASSTSGASATPTITPSLSGAASVGRAVADVLVVGILASGLAYLV